MGIQFYCEHCRQSVTAPDDAGGRQGKCPHCGGTVYIPNPEATDGEIPLAPLDDAEEQQRERAAQEARELQLRLLQEQATPGEPGSRKGRRSEVMPSALPAGVPVKELNRLIVQYVEAMAAGRLDTAEQLLARLVQQRLHVLTIIDGMASEDLSAYGLPALPRPVLLGFLKQLRTRLQQSP